MGTDAQAWNSSYIPPFTFALEAGALTPARIRYGLITLAWFTEDLLVNYLLSRWEDGERDDVWEPLALLLGDERESLRARLRELAPEDGDAADFWMLTALDWLAAHREHHLAWHRLTELWYLFGMDHRLVRFAPDWDGPGSEPDDMAVEIWDRVAERIRDAVAGQPSGGSESFAALYIPAEDDATKELLLTLPIDYLFEVGGFTPERVLYGLERNWLDESELVRRLAQNWWADPVWGGIARMLPEELGNASARLAPFVRDRVEAAERFWRYAVVGYLFRQPPSARSDLELEEVWCAFGHPEDLFPFAPRFQWPRERWRPWKRREKQTFRGIWGAYLVEQGELLGVPVIDWSP